MDAPGLVPTHAEGDAMTQSDGAIDPAPPSTPPPPPPPTVSAEPWVDQWPEQSLRGSGGWDAEAAAPLLGVVLPPEGYEHRSK